MLKLIGKKKKIMLKIFCFNWTYGDYGCAGSSEHLLLAYAWVKVFRINPEFRILRLTFMESQPPNAELRRLL